MVPCPCLSAFGGGGRAEEGRGGRREEGGGREEEGGSREEGGGGRREEGEEQAADEVGRELLLDEVEEAVALGHRRVVGEVPGVEPTRSCCCSNSARPLPPWCRRRR